MDILNPYELESRLRHALAQNEAYAAIINRVAMGEALLQPAPAIRIDGAGKSLCPSCMQLRAKPTEAEYEAHIDGIVGLIRGVIEHRMFHDCYGPLALSEDQRDELANAITQNLIIAFRMERI